MRNHPTFLFFVPRHRGCGLQSPNYSLFFHGIDTTGSTWACRESLVTRLRLFIHSWHTKRAYSGAPTSVASFEISCIFFWYEIVFLAAFSGSKSSLSSSSRCFAPIYLFLPLWCTLLQFPRVFSSSKCDPLSLVLRLTPTHKKTTKEKRKTHSQPSSRSRLLGTRLFLP